MPGLLLMLLSSTVLGVTLLAKRFRPGLPAVLLALMIPFAFAILQVTSMGSAALPVMFAFGILGRRIARAEGAAARLSGRRLSACVTSRDHRPVASHPAFVSPGPIHDTDAGYDAGQEALARPGPGVLPWSRLGTRGEVPRT